MQNITHFFAHEHRRKDPGQCFPAGVLDRTLGHWGTVTTRPEETPMVARISRGRDRGLSTKIRKVADAEPAPDASIGGVC